MGDKREGKEIHKKNRTIKVEIGKILNLASHSRNHRKLNIYYLEYSTKPEPKCSAWILIGCLFKRSVTNSGDNG